MNKKNLEENYRKLWTMSQINMPFIYSVLLLQEKWGLPIKAKNYITAKNNTYLFLKKLIIQNEEYIKSYDSFFYQKTCQRILKLNISNNSKKRAICEISQNLPAFRFLNDITSLMKEFKFEDKWLSTIERYVISDYISPTDFSPDKNIPPKSIKNSIHMLSLNVLKKLQKKHLKEKGFKDKRRNAESKGKYIEDLDFKNRFLPKGMELIKSHQEIADRIWGKIDIDQFTNEQLSKIDKRREGKVKKGLHELKNSKYYVSLTSKEKERLNNLFLT